MEILVTYPIFRIHKAFPQLFNVLCALLIVCDLNCPTSIGLSDQDKNLSLVE